MEYLDFELPLKELKDQLEKCNEIGDESKVDVRDTSRKLKEKIEAKKKEIPKPGARQNKRMTTCQKMVKQRPRQTTAGHEAPG